LKGKIDQGLVLKLVPPGKLNISQALRIDGGLKADPGLPPEMDGLVVGEIQKQAVFLFAPLGVEPDACVPEAGGVVISCQAEAGVFSDLKRICCLQVNLSAQAGVVFQDGMLFIVYLSITLGSVRRNN
jgi:hypothetical protein